jgi:hypothetical protein
MRNLEALGYDLRLSECKRFVIFRPQDVADDPDEFTRRRVATGKFALENGVSSILMDYRDVALPISQGFYDAFLNARELRVKGAWRIAVLVSRSSVPYSKELARGLTVMLEAIGQDAAKFIDHPAAVEWLVAESAHATAG